MKLDNEVRKHNRKALREWWLLFAVAAILFTLLLRFGPGLAYKLLYEKHVRETIHEECPAQMDPPTMERVSDEETP